MPTARIGKELKGLRLPWLIALIAALFTPYNSWLPTHQTNEVLRLLGQLCGILSVAGIVIATAMTFGQEFQLRTFPFLLGQPIPRAKLWLEKHIALGVVTLTIVLAIGLNALLRRQAAPSLDEVRFAPLNEKLMYCFVLLATLSSAGLWTLMARSTIGGMAFNASGICAASALAAVIIEKVFGGNGMAPTIIVTGVAYCAISQWLGWQTFKEWQSADAAGADTRGMSSWRFLRCRPAGALTNLWRKELRLQQPIVLIGMVFVVCWFLVLVLYHTSATYRWNYGVGLNALTVVYLVVVAVLTGAVSLGEERAMGVLNWQLTLPKSAGTQWFIKLSATILSALVFGFALPLILSALTAPQENIGLIAIYQNHFDGQTALRYLFWGVLAVNFWSVTLAGTTVRAALTTVISCVIFFAVIGLGLYAADSTNGFGRESILFLISLAQISNIQETCAALLVAGIAVFFALMLYQSFLAFKNPELSIRRMVYSSIALCLMLFVGSFCYATLQVTGAQVLREMEKEVGIAVVNAATTPAGDFPKHELLGLSDLESRGGLSEQTAFWLRNTVIEASLVEIPNHGRLDRACAITVTWQNQLYFFCSQLIPERNPSASPPGLGGR